MLVIGIRILLSRGRKWFRSHPVERWEEKEMNMKRLKNTLLYIVRTPVALLAAIIFSTWLRLPDWAKKIWYRFWMCAKPSE